MRSLPALLFAACAIALMAASGNAFSQSPSEVTLPAITVTGSRLPARIARPASSAEPSRSLPATSPELEPQPDAPPDTTIITRRDIEAQRPTSAVDLLRQVPGLHIDQPGSRGGVSSVYMRGADPNFTMVMIDGIRVNDPTNSRGGSFNFNSLDPGSIERIEIVRGPLSSVYGSDAMAGAINIITRSGGKEPRAAVQAEGGRFGYFRTWSEVSGPFPGGSIALSGAYADDGHPIEGSTYRGSNFNGSMQFAPAQNTTVRLNSYYTKSRSTAFPDDSGGPLYAAIRDTDKRDSEALTAGAEIRHDAGGGLALVARASHFGAREIANSPGVAPGVRDPFGIVPNSSDSRFDRNTVTAYAQYAPTRLFGFTAGAEAIFEDGTSDSTLLIGGTPVPGHFGLSRRIYAPFGEARIALPFGLTIEGGLRADFPDAFKQAVSPRVGVRQAFEQTGTTLSASWGKGFKLPSFFALGNPIVGNRDLVPETSETVQAGIEQKIAGAPATVRATVFHSDYQNLIDFVEGPPPRLENLSRVVAKGYELGIDVYPVRTLKFGGNLTFVDTEIVDSDQRLRNRPRWRSGGYVQWLPRDDVTVSLNAAYLGSVFDSSIATGDLVLDPYLRLDFAVTWRVRPNFDVSLAVQNLLNAHYEEAVGFPGVGIRPRLIARATF
jgi:vitamin B12 transporter